MTTIIPPPPPSPVPIPTAPMPTVTVPNPPTALTQMSIGSAFNGTVVQMDSKGIFQLQTPLGTFAIQTAVAMPQGASLTMQLNSIVPQLMLNVISINGKPPRHGSLGNVAGKGMVAGGMAKGGAMGSPSPVSLTVGSTVSATFMRPSHGQIGGGRVGGQAGVMAAQGPQGGLLTNPLNAVQGKSQEAAPTASGQKSPSTIPGQPVGQQGRQGQQQAAAFPYRGAGVSSRASGQHTQPGQASAQAHGQGQQAQGHGQRQAALPSGAQFTVKIITLQPPAQSGGPILSLPQVSTSLAVNVGQSLAGVVINTSLSGHSIVQTEIGEISLASRTSLPEGTSLALEVASKPTISRAPPGAFVSDTAESMFGARDWPALKEAVAVIQDADPAAARNLLNNVIPRPDSQLGANVLFFLSALRGGDLRDWLGDSVNRILKTSKPGLANRLGDDFATLGHLANKTADHGDWRVLLVPFYNGADIEQIRMLTRHHGGDDDTENEKQESTRFVIDVELNKVGRLQLDGLLRQQGKHMDLIVRSNNHLPDDMRNGIREIFKESSELTGVMGGVSFQSSPANFIEVATSEVAADVHNGLVV